MKIEQINENQIRCTLTATDLADRSLRLSELAYGSAKASALFRELVEMASRKWGFNTDGHPLMVEAVPVTADGLVLTISRIEEPEEIDTRFARFTEEGPEEGPEIDPAAPGDSLAFSEKAWDEDETSHAVFSDDAASSADDLQELRELLRRMGMERDTWESNEKDASGDRSGCTQEKTETAGGEASAAEEKKAVQQEPEQDMHTAACEFSTLEEICQVCRVLPEDTSCESFVCKNPVSGHYFMFVRGRKDSLDFNTVCSVAAEYGSVRRLGRITLAYWREHYETIVRENAIAVLHNL